MVTGPTMTSANSQDILTMGDSVAASGGTCILGMLRQDSRLATGRLGNKHKFVTILVKECII